MNVFYSDEASTPAKELDSKPPTLEGARAENRDRMLRKMQQLAFLREGHEGPEVGTKYNIPSQGG